MINRRCSTRSLRVTCVRLSTGKRRYFLERRLDMMRGRAGITILNQRVLARLLAVCDPPPAPATVTPTPGPAAARLRAPRTTQ